MGTSLPSTESNSCDGKLFLSTSPPSPAESIGLAQGLFLNGSQLEAPCFVDMGWKSGQRFSESDDPDRMREPWTAPGFVKEPAAETSVGELAIPEKLARAGSFARVVHGVLSESQCAELISSVNRKGFTPALLNVGRGSQKLEPYVRNGHRAIVDSPELGQWLLEALRPHLPANCCGAQLVELNERCRILCYTPGQEFASHFDGNYRRSNGDVSKVTVQVYLHDVLEENGGATTFHFGRASSLPCQPKAGSALLFSQDLEHEGSLLKKGLKYTLRTEAMYRKP
eukprot:TRINITY_DN75886_c0_g1_i1.p1 TRINITY_DN75886_c0_g1~~TRINITY_DN75886_c0_g1_i1.p1  ORF type:complete len:283 (-),score=37.97 TRINITY_DN75886_c0_g1_i1:92-940(-)